jgi:predicted CXXCH cytochrome family protein
MKTRRIGVKLALALTATLFAVTVRAEVAKVPSLTSDDCIKCHTSEPADVAKAGGKHKDVGCNECHTAHRPSSKNNIPECSNCHTGKPHYELKGCLGCHRNPHMPKNIVLPPNITDPCVSCHTQQIKQLQDYKSKHTLLFCSTCHEVHGQIPQCVKCHKPHGPEMPGDVCKDCHKAHMPKIVIYGAGVPNKECGACHKKALDLLAANTTKHHTLACAFCHKAQHKMIPKCQDCHGTPHPAAMLAKFPKCGDCHSIAHDLNHWQQP